MKGRRQKPAAFYFLLSLSRGKGNHAKPAIGVVVGAGTEEELGGRTVIAGMAEHDRPQLVDLDRPPGGVAQYAEKGPGAGIEGVNPAFGDVVGDQQSSAERTKPRGRSHGQSPG